MNKANLFKRKTHSQNQNTLPDKSKLFSQTLKQNHPFRPYHHSSSSYNQNSFQSNSQNQNLSKFTSPARRLKTQQFQIQPFSEIDNFMHFTHKTEAEESFIKTKRAKLYQKTSIRQSQNKKPSSKRTNRFESNFQILKKEIQELQSLQILRGANGLKQSNLQTITIEPYDKNGDKLWKQDDGFIASKEFSCGKNISLMQKQRQNIKKVIKNKKFRNYINLYNKNKEVPKKENQDFNPIKDFLANETFTKTFISLKNPEVTENASMVKSQQLKKKQTPQIVKKYYRPQSCNTKRQTMAHYSRPKKMKVELANFVSFSCFSKSCQKRQAPKIQLSQSLYNQAIQKSKKTKELIVVCL